MILLSSHLSVFFCRSERLRKNLRAPDFASKKAIALFCSLRRTALFSKRKYMLFSFTAFSANTKHRCKQRCFVLSMGYKKDIFRNFAYEFELSKKFKSSAKRIPLLLHYSLLLLTFQKSPLILTKQKLF